jgi:FtsZ-interacting cell division protein YlmF
MREALTLRGTQAKVIHIQEQIRSAKSDVFGSEPGTFKVIPDIVDALID